MTAAPAAKIAQLLASEYPLARTELDHRSAFELLVATVLSAQTTDQRVNSLTPDLFLTWPDAASLAGAPQEDVAALLRPLGMGATRAARIIALAQGLVREHGGEVPDDQRALEALPGVGRKTAHVLRGEWFGHELLAVDTHVTRLAGRLGWSGSGSARRVEDDVVAQVRADPDWPDAATPTAAGASGRGGGRPEAEGPAGLTLLGQRLIHHGRRVCTARAPRCGGCVLRAQCPRIGVAEAAEEVGA